MIRLSRESMEANFRKYLETVFEHREIIRAGVRNIAITRENMEDAGKRAFEACFHDSYLRLVEEPEIIEENGTTTIKGLTYSDILLMLKWYKVLPR